MIIRTRYPRSLLISIAAAAIVLSGHGEAAARTFAPNGCGTASTKWLVPQYRFVPACNRHDECYARALVSRQACDDRFLADMQAICAPLPDPYLCRYAARVYWAAVRVFGGWAWDADRRARFEWQTH